MAKELRVGIVGCGKIAHADHVPGYLTTKGVRIVSLLDIKRSQIAKLKKAMKLDAEGFTNWDKFVASGLDAVTICTPNNFHYPQTMTALKAGLHVLCEKPMAAKPSEAQRMGQAAKRAGRVLQINQTLHYIPLYQKIAQLVQSGAIGEPLHVRCIRAGGSTPDESWSPGAKWFVQKKHQGGVVLDIGVHMADLMRWSLGEIVEIAAYVDTRKKGIDVPDNVSALMRFANGATGVLELSWTMPVGAGLLEIYGRKGTIRQGYSEKHPIELIKPGAAGKPNRVTYPKPAARAKHSQQCFVDAIRGRGKSVTPGELGRDAIALCDAIVRSSERGRFVRVRKF
jgi:predicted dehydrogenase